MIFDVIARTSGAEGSFRAVGKEAEKAGLAFDRLGKAAAGITVAVAAFAVNAAAKFESSMTRISTQAGVPIKDIKALGDSLLQLSPKVGFNPDDLATSLYHVESAFRTTGITAGKAIDIVKYASELAKIGNANLEDTTQAIIGTLSSKIKGVKDAADAAAQLNQLVGTGDTTLQAVVKAIGTGILPTAQALGLSFKDISAGLSTLSDNATPIDEAATRFRTTLSLIENPSAKATAALSSIGLSTVSLAEDFRKPRGLLVAMEDLQTHLNATYPLTKTTALSTDQIAAATKNYTGQLLAQGVQAKVATDLGNKYAKSLKEGGSAATLQAQTILSAFGGAKTGSTFLTLYGELDRLKSKYADTGTAAEAAGKFQQAWANQQQTAKQKLDELKASWDKFLIQAGNAILPTLKEIVDFLAQHPGVLKAAALGVATLAAAWAAMKVGNLVSSLAAVVGRIFAIGTASTVAAGEVTALSVATKRASFGSLIADADRLAYGLGPKGVAGATRGIATEAEGAAGGLAGIGTAGAGAGLLAGGALAVGLGALALDIHQIVTDGQVKHLPALDTVAAAIAKGGLGGKPVTDVVQASLAGVSSGDNRHEDQLTYLTRVLSSTQAKAVDTTSGLKFNLQDLFKTIQTGTQGDMTGYINSLREVGFELKGSPATISKVGDYLQGLFSRLNSGRVAATANAKAVHASAEAYKEAQTAVLGTSTNVGFLSKQLHISAAAAKSLALENSIYNDAISQTGIQLVLTNQSLTDNTVSAKMNRRAISDAAQEVELHATAVLKQTGSLKLSDAVFQQGIATVERNSVALGANKADVDKLIDSLGLVPPITQSDIKMTGIATALQEVANFQAFLDRQQWQRQLDISVETTGSAPAWLLTQATAGGRGGFNGLGMQADGGIYPRGVPGGLVQWAEAGGESFIPLSPSKRPQSLRLWQRTGELLGVSSMADGGIRGGGTSFVHGPTYGSLLHVEHWHGDQTDVKGTVSAASMHARAHAMARKL